MTKEEVKALVDEDITTNGTGQITGAILNNVLNETVDAITKENVELGNCDNTSDANKPVSTAQQTALNLKANIASPTFTGNPQAPTKSQADNSTSLATTAYVDTGLATKQNELPYVAENAANKATTMSGNTTSNIVYLTAKAVYDWAVGLFVQTGSDASVKSLTVTGTNGLGHVHLKHQVADATATGSSTVVFADSNGDVKTKNDGGFYSTHKTSTNSADRVYTYPNESVTLAGITQSITNGDTTKAPSGDVVFDALATKSETFKGQRFTAGPVTEVAGTTVYRISTALSAINMLAIDSNVLADARVLYVINEDGTNTINVSAPSIEFNGGGVGNPYTIAAAAGEMAMFMFDGTAQSNVFVKTL